jgi:uncharacterized protein (DUF1778 family)
MKRRKLKTDRKEAMIQIRLTDEQKAKLAAAAKAAGLDVSGWLRFIGLKAAESAAKV